MVNKTFIVSHPKARAPITITGKTLEEALEQEGLDPSVWKPVDIQPESEVEELGETQESSEQEGN